MQLSKSIFVDVGIISAIGLLSITWFKGDFVLAYGDASLIPDRLRSFFCSFYVWYDYSELGMSNFRLIAGIFPYRSFYVFTEFIGLSEVIAQKIWVYLTFTVSGFSMYFLTSNLVQDRRKRLASLLSALFYMMNQYVALYVIVPVFGFLLIYPFLPLILALYIRGIKGKRIFKDSFLLNSILLLTTSSFVNPVFAIIVWLLLFSFLTFYLILMKERMYAIYFTFLSLIMWVVLNAYWILPEIYGVLQEITRVRVAYSSLGVQGIGFWKTWSAPVLGVLRLTGFWSLTSGYKGDPYVYWAALYSSPLFVAISFLIPLVVFSSILFKPRNAYVLYFSLLAVVGVFLVKGPYPPLELINIWLFNEIPLFSIFFAMAYLMFGSLITLSYSFLIGVGAASLYHYISGQKSMQKFCKRMYFRRAASTIYLVSLIFILFGVYNWPFWTGDVVYPGGSVVPSWRVNAPSYYYNASDWLKKQENIFNIFSLPTNLYYATYWWDGGHGYLGADPTAWFLGRPVVSAALSGNGLTELISRLIVTNSSTKVAKILTLINSKYLLFHNDSNWRFLEGHSWWISTSPESFRATLNSQEGLSLEKSFGQLDFYRNEYWTPMYIYTTTNNILIDGSLNQMMQIAERDDFKPGESVLLLSDQLDTQQFSSLPLNTIFFQGQEFLNLIVSKVGGYVIAIPSDASVSAHNGSIVVNATFFVNTTQAYDPWIEMPYTYIPGEVSMNLDGSSVVNGYRLTANNLLSSSWINLGKVPLSKGNHIVTLTIIGGEAIPDKIAFTPDQAFNSTYNTLSNATRDGRLVYAMEPQSLITARYYSGWKGVISTNGQGDQDMLIFPSPNECPYISAFPLNFTSWNAYNSTLIYITTGPSPLTINSIIADGTQVSASAWWQTDTSWRTNWPITIPPNQTAIIQVQNQSRLITLQTDSGTTSLPVTDGWTNPPPIKAPSETSTTIFTPRAGNYLLAIKVATGYGYGTLSTKIDDKTFSIDVHSQEQGPVFTYKYIGPINLTAGYHTISTSGVNATIPVYDGWTNPINWTSTFTNRSYAARYYTNWKAVVRTDGSEPWDTLSFPTPDQCPYTFPSQSSAGWNAYNATLVYLVTGDKPQRIDEILADGKPASDIGVWWETGWMGMSTKPVAFPMIIPANQKAIIQINHKADTVTLKTNPPQIESMQLYSLRNGEKFADADNLLSSNQAGNASSITYEKINPTKYVVHVNTSNPFSLVFSESYDKGWVAYVDGQQISDEYHFITNGYANGWYVNKTGAYTVTLEFWPQKLFYIGSAISITTLIICVLYISKNKIKTAYKRYIEKNN